MVRPINVYKKICIIGDTKSGKTSIVNRYIKDMFTEKYIPSIGTKVSKKNVEIKDPSGQTQGINVNLMIWDLLGSREQMTLARAFYQGAEGGIVVCDATRDDSIEHISFWVDNFRTVVKDKAPIIIALNKVDEVEKNKMMEDIKTIKALCLELNVANLQVSAKNGESIDILFYTISENIIDTRPF